MPSRESAFVERHQHDGFCVRARVGHPQNGDSWRKREERPRDLDERHEPFAAELTSKEVDARSTIDANDLLIEAPLSNAAHRCPQ
jgi:hypothetical protein